MKYFSLSIAMFCLPIFAFCQDITGLWKGTLFNDSTKQSLDYEIVINKVKGKYAGYSHTWFLIGDQKYYGIKKIQVRIAKDGKIIMQDAGLMEENYPILPYKNIYQLNVLDLSKEGDEMILGGAFVTNRTKQYNELTGQVNIKKVNPLNQSDLMQYLQKNGEENILTALKK